MLQQKFKPNKDKLKLKEIKIPYKGYSPKEAEQKTTFVKNQPQFYYSGVELPAQLVTKMVVDCNKFLPMCYICFNDTYNMMHDIGFPGDNSKITIVLPSNTDGLANPFMDFKIQKYHVELSKRSNYKKIHFWGICNIDKVLLKEYKSYPNTTSFDLMKSFAQDAGMGFVTNLESTSDQMTWLNTSLGNDDFLQSVTHQAWAGESSFMWSFVDLFYNLNYIDVERQLADSIDDIQWVSTDVFNNTDLEVRSQQANGITKPLLTNESSQRGKNNFFTGEKIMNQSTNTSLKRGYLRTAYFYDIDGNWEDKAGAYKKYDLDTITSPGSESSSVILKGDPGDLDFYRNNKTYHYMDRIDTINAYPDYLWARLQNSENLQDLQKVSMQIMLPLANYNIKRFENIKLLYTNNNVGINTNKKNAKLNGTWLVTGFQFEWSGKALYQYVNIVKRELSVDDL